MFVVCRSQAPVYCDELFAACESREDPPVVFIGSSDTQPVAEASAISTTQGTTRGMGARGVSVNQGIMIGGC